MVPPVIHMCAQDSWEHSKGFWSLSSQFLSLSELAGQSDLPKEIALQLLPCEQVDEEMRSGSQAMNVESTGHVGGGFEWSLHAFCAAKIESVLTWELKLWEPRSRVTCSR